MNKAFLNVAILLSGIVLSFLHYHLKPAPSDREIRDQSRYMRGGVDWQGQIAPDFELTTTRGEHFKLSENVGKKIIVLNFFATWCGPCRAEMPELNRYFNQHKADSFLLIGIDAEEKQDRVDAFFDELKLDFSAGVDNGPIRKLYGVDSFPTTVLIGVDGKVQFYETGALFNAEVAFDNLLRQNRELMSAGKVISAEDYRTLAQKQSGLRVREPEPDRPARDEYKLDERGKRIAAKMVCPCGCDDKVQVCNCNTSKNVKKALGGEDFKDKPDDQIVKELNKRFCSGAM